MPSTQPAGALSRTQIFLRRLLSALVLWGVVIGALFAGYQTLSDLVFLLLMLLLAFGGLMEFYGLVEKRGLICFKGLGIFGGMLLMTSTFLLLSRWGGPGFPFENFHELEAFILILLVLGVCIRQFLPKGNTAGLVAAATTLFGFMYVPWLLNFIQRVYYYPNIEGAYFLLYFVLVTKFSDMGAYVFGSLFGRHKMMPSVSPGKTWEGFAGAILASGLAGFLFVHFAEARMAGMPLAQAGLLGVFLGAAAVLGDLIESLFKREAGVKDSGNLIPGIGGVLDLLDSLLFNAPLMYLYLRYVLVP
jgi:phosphatidate cytidylyltransferase